MQYDLEEFKEFAAARNYVMEPEEQKTYNGYIDWYKAGWKDKDDRGLLNLWEKVDLYWEGDVNRSNSIEEPGSNTNIVHPNVEGEVALLVEKNLAITVVPRTPSDAPYVEVTRIMLEWVKEQNRMKRKLDIHERRRKKYGTGIFKVMFDSKYMNGFGLPTIENVQPAYLIIDPNITDVYKMQDGEFIIEPVMKSIYYARKRFGDDIAAAIIPNYSPIEYAGLDMFGETDNNDSAERGDSYIHLYIWTKDIYTKKLKLLEMSACGVKLEDSSEKGTKFPKDMYPYFITPMYFRDGCIWGKGDAELLIDVQDIINEFDDTIRIHARLTGNPQRIVSTLSGIDINKLTNEAGLNISSNDMNGLKFLEPPRFPTFITQRRNYALEVEAPKMTRFFDQMMGAPQKGVDTATESMNIQRSASAGTNHKKAIFEETMVDVFTYILEMCKEFYTDEQAFRITEIENNFAWFKGSSLKNIPATMPITMDYAKKWRQKNPKLQVPQEMLLTGTKNEVLTKEAEFDLIMSVGSGVPDNEAFIYTMMREAVQMGAISAQDLRKYMVTLGLPVTGEAPVQPVEAQPPKMKNAALEGATSAGYPGRSVQ